MRKAITQKNTLLKTAASPRCEPKFLREYFFLQPKKKFNFFSPTLQCFIFFAAAQPTTDKHSGSLLQTFTGQYNLTWTTEARTGNSVLPQLAVTCKIEDECSYQTFVQVDSEVFRNRQLRQHAKRWQQA